MELGSRERNMVEGALRMQEDQQVLIRRQADAEATGREAALKLQVWLLHPLISGRIAMAFARGERWRHACMSTRVSYLSQPHLTCKLPDKQPQDRMCVPLTMHVNTCALVWQCIHG